MKVWKVAPGRNAAVWDECLEDGVTSINWLNKYDLAGFDDKRAVTQELQKRDEGSTVSANSIWHFVNEILPGHLIVANDGRSRVVGIGVCRSRYLSPKAKANPRRNAAYHRHCRLVDWFSTIQFDVEPNLFIPATVQELHNDHQAKIHSALKKVSAREASRLKKKLANKSLPMSDEEGTPEGFKPVKGDFRTIVTRQIAERRGGRNFRNQLVSRYEGQCLVTGCKLLDVLEAAHIKPYRGEKDNHVENGLLLRSDIHTLFDLNLLGINPNSLTVELEATIASQYDYKKYHRMPIKFPNKLRPSKRTLSARYKQFLAERRP